METAINIGALVLIGLAFVAMIYAVIADSREQAAFQREQEESGKRLMEGVAKMIHEGTKKDS